MSAEQQIAALLRIAEEDIEATELLWRSKNRNAWYLCEQAAEKLIRAVLTSEGKHGGIRHHLDEMVDLIPDENPLKEPLRQIEMLSAYATSFRYPTASGRIPRSHGDLTEILALVTKIHADLVAHFQVDLRSEGPAGKGMAVR